MERHVANATAVANWLEARPDVEWVNYAGLASSPWHELQVKYLPGWRIDYRLRHKGRRRSRSKFIEGLELFSHLANVGDAKASPSIRRRRPTPSSPKRSSTRPV